MKSNYKKVSSHGSINIPVAMRRALGIQGGDPMEVSAEGGTVVVKPYLPRCVVCGTNDGTKVHRLQNGKHICTDCTEEAYRTVAFGTDKEEQA